MGRLLRTVWPSLLRSIEGWFGGRTSFVVPMTGHDILEIELCCGVVVLVGVVG